MPKGDKLGGKQLAFVDAYFANGFNASLAMITAGYAPKTASVTGCKLLTTANVKAEVEKRKAEIAKAALWTREDSIRELKKVISSPDRKSDITNSVKILNEMHGYNEPLKIEHSGQINLVKRIIVDPVNSGDIEFGDFAK